MDAEMSLSQHNMILRLLDQRYVTIKCASRIIEMLMEMPVPSDSGLDISHLKDEVRKSQT